MNLNKSIITIIVLIGIFSFIMGPVTKSFAQANQTSSNQTTSSKSLSSSDISKTSRTNGSSIATANEHAMLVKNPGSINQTNTISEKVK